MRKTLSSLRKMYRSGEKIACLTAYDAGFAHWVAEAGVDVILVGDSLGMVVQGHATTLPVTLDEVVYHTQMVQRVNRTAWCIADLPFMEDVDLATTLKAAGRLMKEGGANMVKLEGGKRILDRVQAMAEIGIPVCCHLGLLPQSVEKHGYKVQGRDEETAVRILKEALELQSAGADMLVLECIPAALAEQITRELNIPVIGIGAGADTSGQVLVLHDILGITLGKPPSFSKNYLQESASIQEALSSYVQDVKSGAFPADCHLIA
ncbi:MULTISPECIES: 3-methyl-2-oxobutanoate hydroxymethyltransferase [Thiomicrorhabdus]|uniref:3-methyl-2-oxobutanoate hydroxymethyltransferase n=1 Tax=Thiomicrorhabdus heinhorstiae TaxID=2748010 RepID=A0ABS0BY56_9GAMM|nr:MULTISPECIES: 3-methyl-2-oxobutanoate hydroxymethyltransferase [Thiomicrorhabdus]MBF6058720.1 3-methyl-2-oxobutanoate hydroxymethyltransferase [Thiomicrorhabdus heinhorstiae]